MKVLIKYDVSVPWLVTQADGGYVAECEPLKLTAEGNTRRELDSVIREIMYDWSRAREGEALQHGFEE